MRGNAWQVTAIIAIILVVVLIVPLVIMGRDHQTKTQTARDAEQQARTAAQRAATLEGENDTLKSLIGVPVNTDENTLRELHRDLMDKILPGENDNTRTYHGAIASLRASLAREKEAHKTTSDKLAQTQSELTNEQNKFAEARNRLNEEMRREADERRALGEQFADNIRNFELNLRDAKGQIDKTLNDSERMRFDLTGQVQQLTNDNRDIRDTNINLAGMLEDIRNPNVEHPAGKIISVDQLAGTAVVNLGSADGLQARTMFSVYPPSITGLTFRTVASGHDAVYCDMCRREISRDAAKGSVEVMRILGAHRAEVRILEDILKDPIMAGDVVYSPIWKPGHKMSFALGASVFVPNSGDDPGVEAMIRLIEMNGGVVSCWIDEKANVADGEDYLKGEITDFTNYLVLNERVRPSDPEVERIQQALIESARNRAIKVISLDDLLSRMGWKNVTPVYTFGSRVFTPEMRVIPQPQGTHTQSNGVVSPTFTPYNADARINARDANPARSSSGVVSSLFNDNAPPPPSSSGKVSDLYQSAPNSSP